MGLVNTVNIWLVRRHLVVARSETESTYVQTHAHTVISESTPVHFPDYAALIPYRHASAPPSGFAQ